VATRVGWVWWPRWGGNEWVDDEVVEPVVVVGGSSGQGDVGSGDTCI